MLIAIPVGVISAVWCGTFLDFMTTNSATIGTAMPNLWLGLILIFISSVQSRWLPSFGAEHPLALIEAHSLLREALTCAGDIRATRTSLHVTLDALSAPRRTRARASLCKHLNATETTYPGTNLIIRYAVKPHPTLA